MLTLMDLFDRVLLIYVHNAVILFCLINKMSASFSGVGSFLFELSFCTLCIVRIKANSWGRGGLHIASSCKSFREQPC